MRRKSTAWYYIAPATKAWKRYKAGDFVSVNISPAPTVTISGAKFKPCPHFRCPCRRFSPLGEAMVEFNQSKRDESNYLQGFGGDLSNFLIAASRQDAATGFVSAVGNDYFGQLLLDLWRSENVDTSAVRVDHDAPTASISCRMARTGIASITCALARQRRYAPSHLPRDTIAAAKVVHLSGISLVIGVSAYDAALAAIDHARARREGQLRYESAPEALAARALVP